MLIKLLLMKIRYITLLSFQEFVEIYRLREIGNTTTNSKQSSYDRRKEYHFSNHNRIASNLRNNSLPLSSNYSANPRNDDENLNRFLKVSFGTFPTVF